MSMQEIYGLTMELHAIRDYIERQHGVIVRHEGKLNIEDELKAIRKELMKLGEGTPELELLKERIARMEIDLSKLAEEVTRAQTVQSSAVVLIQSLAKKFEDVSAELAKKAAEVPPSFDATPLNDLIEKLKGSTSALATAVADSAGVTPMKEVVLNADNPAVPTVVVTMPEVMPEVVTVSAEVVVDKVDPVSTEPQIAITVEPAADAVVTSENVVTDVIKTDEGFVDVVVAADADHHTEVKEEHKVDVIEEVKAAFEATPEVTPAPVVEAPPAAIEEPAPGTAEVVLNADNPSVPTVSVIMPEVMPEVVTVSAEQIVDKVDPASPEPQIEITVEAAPAAEVMADKTADVDVIKTDEGQVDVVVAAPAAVVDEMAKVGVDVVEEVKAAFEAAPEVVAEPAKE